MGNINVRWSGPHLPNWGDILNPIIIKNMTGKAVSYTKDQTVPHYICIGSILQWANSNTTVWGAGFIGSDRRLKEQPDIRAIRGPRSRDIVLSQGYKCPEVYGDPALLYPRYYKPKTGKKYRYGIIPHYIDQDNEWLEQFKGNPDVKIINILNKNVNRFMDDVNECEIILSSSLHGIICGDSLGIPSYWIKLSDKVIGNGFKFYDYFDSVKRTDEGPVIITKDLRIKDFTSTFYDYEIDIDLDLLLKSAPF